MIPVIPIIPKIPVNRNPEFRLCPIFPGVIPEIPFIFYFSRRH